jgi:FlaA1/EpsC-like NDP-sugar epimerase
MILDMGEPVRILDVAQRMISMSGRDIEIVYTGLRAGEKLHEDLMGSSEQATRSSHPKISQTQVEAFAPHDLHLQSWRDRIARHVHDHAGSPVLATSGGGLSA